jgi:hypothetical protein
MMVSKPEVWFLYVENLGQMVQARMQVVPAGEAARTEETPKAAPGDKRSGARSVAPGRVERARGRQSPGDKSSGARSVAQAYLQALAAGRDEEAKRCVLGGNQSPDAFVHAILAKSFKQGKCEIRVNTDTSGNPESVTCSGYDEGAKRTQVFTFSVRHSEGKWWVCP